MGAGRERGHRLAPTRVRRRLALFHLFKRGAERDALTAVTFAEDGIGVAAIRRDPTFGPQLKVCEFHQHDGADAAHALRELLTATGSRRSRCTTLLESADYQLLLVEAPDVEATELKAAIRWRIKDLIDFHIDDAVVDVVAIPAQDRGRARMMYVVAARAPRIRERVAVIEDAGLELVSIDIEELALRNLAALADTDGRGVCLLWFGADHGCIVVVRDGELYLARRLETGCTELFSAAQHGDPDAGALGAPLTAALDHVTLELQRSLDYYDSHFSLPPIGGIVVAPCAPDLPFVTPYLAANLGVAVAPLDLDRVFPGAPEIDATVRARALTAIGAALREEEVAL